MTYQNTPQDQDSSPAGWTIVIAVLLGLLIALCSSCMSVTVAKTKGGTEVAHIGSFATKSTNRTLRITMPNGVILEAFGDNDETIFPQKALKLKALGVVADKLPGAVNSVSNAIKP